MSTSGRDMVNLFQERYRDLPGFQKALETVGYLRNTWLSDEEVATRIMILVESPLSWDTLCHNCSALMDDNYHQYGEIAGLSEENLALKKELDELKIAMARTGTGLALCKDCKRLALVNYPHQCHPEV